MLLSITWGEHFWRQVVLSATEGLPLVWRSMYAPAKISKLDGTKAIQQILWLDITMNDVFRVDVLQCLAHLKNVASWLLLRERQHDLALQVLVELALWTVLQDQIDLILVKEKAIKLHDIWMSQMALDLNFPKQLVHHSFLEELSFVENFQWDNKLALLLSRKVHTALPATTERPADFKVVDWPFRAVKIQIASIWKVARLKVSRNLF